MHRAQGGRQGQFGILHISAECIPDGKSPKQHSLHQTGPPGHGIITAVEPGQPARFATPASQPEMDG